MRGGNGDSSLFKVSEIFENPKSHDFSLKERAKLHRSAELEATRGEIDTSPERGWRPFKRVSGLEATSSLFRVNPLNLEDRGRKGRGE